MKPIDLDGLVAELRALATTEDHGAAPIAFFDADHTLWAGDVADLVYRAFIEARAIRPEAIEPLAAMCAKAGLPSARDPHADAQRLLDNYLQDRVPDELMVVAQTICYAGHSPASLRSFALPLIERALHPELHEGIRELLAALRTAKIGVRVISGSPQALVELGVETLGIAPEECAGIVLQRDASGNFAGEVEYPVTYLHGKVRAMERWVRSSRSLVAFGDSPGDVPMMERAHVRVAVNPRPALVAHARASEPDRWRLFVPARTVSGRPVTAHTHNRTIA